VAPVHVRWSDIDSYQHINHATMVTILEEARIPFLREPFGADITTVGLLIAETQLAAVHIEEQRLQRLSPAQRDYLQHWMR
jgi:acyl-CoA thioester hydrolase